MIIFFTGLHAAGKSYLLNEISQRYDFLYINKKDILRKLYFEETGRIDEDWNLWYGEKFRENPVEIVQRIINEIPVDKDILFDAVHSSYEWELFHGMIDESYLALMVTPYPTRLERWLIREKKQSNIDKKDTQRIGFWHNPYAERTCLPTHASWSFNGAASLELNLKVFEEFYNYCLSQRKQKPKDDIKKLEKKIKPHE